MKAVLKHLPLVGDSSKFDPDRRYWINGLRFISCYANAQFVSAYRGCVFCRCCGGHST